jgi:hypothetical protein
MTVLKLTIVIVYYSFHKITVISYVQNTLMGNKRCEIGRSHIVRVYNICAWGTKGAEKIMN